MPANALKVESREFAAFEATSQNGQVQLSGEYTVTVTNTGILPVPVTLSVTELKLDGNTIIEEKTASLGTVSGEAKGSVEFEATVSSSSAINNACASQPVNAQVNESLSGFLLAIVTEEEVEVKSPSPSCNIGGGGGFGPIGGGGGGPGDGGGNTGGQGPGGGSGGGQQDPGGGGGGDPRDPGSGGGDNGSGGGQPEPASVSITGPSEVNTGETAEFTADPSGDYDQFGWVRSDTNERPVSTEETLSITVNDPGTITVQAALLSNGQQVASDAQELIISEDQQGGTDPGTGGGGSDDPRDPGGGGGDDPIDPGDGGAGGPNIPDQPPGAEVVNVGRQNNPDYGDVAYVNTSQTYEAQSNGDRITQYDTSDYTWDWEMGNETTKSSEGFGGILGSPAQIDYTWNNTGMKTIRVQVTHQDSGQLAMQLTMTEEVTEQGTVIPDPPEDVVVVNKGRQDDPGFGENEAAYNDTPQTYQVRAPGVDGDQVRMYDTSDYVWEWQFGDAGSKSTEGFTGIQGAPSQVDFNGWDNDNTGEELVDVVVTSKDTDERAMNVSMTEPLQNSEDDGGGWGLENDGWFGTNDDGTVPSMDEKAEARGRE